jgi:hypothetical protein
VQSHSGVRVIHSTSRLKLAVEKEAKEINYAYDSNIPREKIFKVILPRPVEFQI